MLTKIDLKQIDRVISTRIKQELKPVRFDLSKVRKDTDVIITLFDREYLDLRKRVEAIEEHLGIQPASV